MNSKSACSAPAAFAAVRTATKSRGVTPNVFKAFTKSLIEYCNNLMKEMRDSYKATKINITEYLEKPFPIVGKNCENIEDVNKYVRCHYKCNICGSEFTVILHAGYYRHYLGYKTAKDYYSGEHFNEDLV